MEHAPPDPRATAWFRHDGYDYWLAGAVPPEIIVPTGAAREFLHDLSFTDPFCEWTLAYDVRKGEPELLDFVGN